jgi:uracil-DNA glycosylase family 4
VTERGRRSAELAELHHEMRACQACLQAGYAIFPRAIFSGAAPAQVMIIGQAPGVTEKDAGRPFNAGSGSRLFAWLSEAGFNEEEFRRSHYMTSVTKCYPGPSPNGGSGDRLPSREEQRLCRPFLDRELALIHARLILPVGRLAINLFFEPNHPLALLIGTEIQIDGRWIIPLPHPSGASRWHQSQSNRERIAEAIDLIRARRMALDL